MDWFGPAGVEQGEDGIQVSANDCPLLPHELAILTTMIDPLDENDDMGVNSLFSTAQQKILGEILVR